MSTILNKLGFGKAGQKTNATTMTTNKRAVVAAPPAPTPASKILASTTNSNTIQFSSDGTRIEALPTGWTEKEKHLVSLAIQIVCGSQVQAIEDAKRVLWLYEIHRLPSGFEPPEQISVRGEPVYKPVTVPQQTTTAETSTSTIPTRASFNSSSQPTSSQ